MSPPYYITGFAAVYTADERGPPVPANIVAPNIYYSAAVASTMYGHTLILHHMQYLRAGHEAAVLL